MLEPLRLFVPVLPGSALSPNARAHWSKKAAATTDLRVYVSTHVLADIRQRKWPGLPLREARLNIEYLVCRMALGDDGYYRPDDGDNALAACKAGIDGLTDAGIWTDDRVVTIGGLDIVEVEAREAEGLAFTVER
jgi:hypothetical protein